MHAVAALAPLPGWYVPAGHSCGAAAPASHQPPGGHTPPVGAVTFPVAAAHATSSTGCVPGHDVALPREQKQPASHAPVGHVSPATAQYRPGRHSGQSVTATALVTLPYRPSGHGNGAAAPAGQYAPCGHGVPAAAPAAQYIPAAQPTHELTSAAPASGP